MLWDKPLWGFSPPSRLAALASPHSCQLREVGQHGAPASSLAPLGCPSPSPATPSGPLLLAPAASLGGHACRVLRSGHFSRAPFLLPSSGATEPLGGLAAISCDRSWAAPHSAATAAAAPSRRYWAAAAVTQASWEPPSPTLAPVVLCLQSLMALADITPPVPPPDELTLGRLQLLIRISTASSSAAPRSRHDTSPLLRLSSPAVRPSSLPLSSRPAPDTLWSKHPPCPNGSSSHRSSASNRCSSTFVVAVSQRKSATAASSAAPAGDPAATPPRPTLSTPFPCPGSPSSLSTSPLALEERRLATTDLFVTPPLPAVLQVRLVRSKAATMVTFVRTPSPPPLRRRRHGCLPLAILDSAMVPAGVGPWHGLSSFLDLRLPQAPQRAQKANGAMPLTMAILCPFADQASALRWATCPGHFSA